MSPTEKHIEKLTNERQGYLLAIGEFQTQKMHIALKVSGLKKEIKRHLDNGTGQECLAAIGKLTEEIATCSEESAKFTRSIKDVFLMVQVVEETLMDLPEYVK